MAAAACPARSITPSSPDVYKRQTLAVAAFYLLLAVIFFAAALWPPSGQVLGGHDMLAYYYGAWDTVGELSLIHI